MLYLLKHPIVLGFIILLCVMLWTVGQEESFQVSPSEAFCGINNTTIFECISQSTLIIWSRNGTKLFATASSEDYNINNVTSLHHSCKEQYNNSIIQCSDGDRSRSNNATLYVLDVLEAVTNIHIAEGNDLTWEAPFQPLQQIHSQQISYYVEFEDLINASKIKETVESNRIPLPELDAYRATIWPINIAGLGEPNDYTFNATAPTSGGLADGAIGSVITGVTGLVIVTCICGIIMGLLCRYHKKQKNYKMQCRNCSTGDQEQGNTNDDVEKDGIKQHTKQGVTQRRRKLLPSIKK